MQARLKVLHDKANVKHVKLLPVTLIGRSTECNLKIASSQVSRNHCRITLGTDAVFVEDLGSANGTLVDGQLIPAHQPTAIAPGTRLIVGPAEFQIDYVASTSATMVLSRTGVPQQPELPPTEVISQSEVSSVATPPPAAVVAAAVAVAAVAEVAPAIEVAATPIAAPVPAVAPVVAAIPLAAPVPVAAPVPFIAAASAAVVVAPPPEAYFPPISQFAPGDTVNLEPGTSFAEAEEAPAETSEDTIFMFQETLPDSAPEESSAAPEAPAKKGGLKSLFSMFGRKSKPAASADPGAVESVAAPSVFLPTVEAVGEVVEEQPNFDETVAIEEKTDEKAPSDGGFDDFLSQF